MSITVGQRYTRASDKTQQEQNVTVSVDSVRVDKEGQILEVPIIKAAAGQKTYFKEITELVRDLLEGSPQGLSRRIPYAILTAAPVAGLDTNIKLYSPWDIDALQVESGDFLLLIRDFSVDPTVDTSGFTYLFCHAVTATAPPLPYEVEVQVPVDGTPPTFEAIQTAYPTGSILINLSKFKPDSTLGDEGQLGVKTQLEQPAVPTFTAEPGAGLITVNISWDDEGVDAFDVFVRTEKPVALTPDMIPDGSFTVEQAATAQNVTTVGGGVDAGGGILSGSPGDYWVTVVAKALNAPSEGGIIGYGNKYKWSPSDPAEPVMVTTT